MARARMKRMMIDPAQFGSRTEYGFAGGEFGSVEQYQAHLDLCRVYTPEHSRRIWEPGRNALSMPGYQDAGDDRDRGVELPLRAKIHGIKGAAIITMGMGDDDYGFWTDETGTVVNVDEFATGREFTRWAVSGVQPFSTGSNDKSTFGLYAIDEDTRWIMAGNRNTVRIPFFFSLYRGTYKYLDDQSGAEIDTGPADDPAVILGLDITNPSVLESPRLDWWDVEYIRPPVGYSPVLWAGRHFDTDIGGNSFTDTGVTISHQGEGGGFHKYPLNLSTDKVLGPDQILWWHVKTGGVKMPVWYLARPEGGSGAPVSTLTCLTYWGHSFSCALHGSMMVSTSLEL